MICPQCGGKNFSWATRCDHCGLALDRTEISAEPPAATIATAETAARDSDENVAPAPASQQTISLTTALMALNGVMFLLVGLRGGFDPSVPMLIDWGANFGPLTVNGQWWRLLTATVLHANVLHLLSNLYALWYVGRLAEPLFGRPSFLLIYLLSGVAGCVSSLWWHPFAAGVGASGAIFGIYGALAAWLAIRHRSMRASTAASLISGVGAMIVYNLLFGFFQKNVDVAAHVGGLVTGLVTGSALAVPLPVTIGWAVARAAIVGAAGLVAIGGLASRVPKVDDLPGAMTRFSDAERVTNFEYEQLLAKLQQREITVEQFADGIEAQVLPRWTSAREQLAHVRAGPEQQTIDDILRYMSLRGDALRLTAEGMRKNDTSMLDAAKQKTTEATAMAMTLSSKAKAGRSTSDQRASEVSISGTVKDVALPVGGAVVSLSCPARQGRAVSRVYLQGCDAPRVVRTDAEGRFIFNRLAPGPYIARVKAAGYVPTEQQVDGQEDAAVTIHLRAAVDFANLVSSVSTLERTTVSRLNAVLADLREKRISSSRFSEAIEKELLPPWETRRAELVKLTLTPGEQPSADTLIEYMKLRGEAWRLLAEGVRTNNVSLMNSAKKKQETATALAKRLAGGNNSGRSSR